MASADTDLVALVSDGLRAAIVGEGVERVLDVAEVPDAMSHAPSTRRYAVWSAARDLRGLADRGEAPSRILDLAETFRLLVGGWRADPGRIWAVCQGLSVDDVDTEAPDDLFSALRAAPEDEDLLIRGHLRSDATTGGWLSTGLRLTAWAGAAYRCATGLWDRLPEAGPRARACAVSESAAALLCVELERDGLPIDRDHAQTLIGSAAGPRPRDAAHAQEIRRARDAVVLSRAPGHEDVDLRSPAGVLAMLHALGVDVPSTRRWVLENNRDAHPVVPALLDWRRDERIATTYGYAWLDQCVGADGRLRGAWTACDGAAGRMTAGSGLHNLPVTMRGAVAAEPGHLFVRADLGQIEPRVLAAVSGDEHLAAATRADDLYAPVAATLGVGRPVAKVAVLAAMYGQRSGTAGRALADLERAYPVAMGFLDEAYAAGAAGESLRTFGGRLITTAGIRGEGSRGRYARNALIQGAAAELFKCWAATVRAGAAALGGQVVLCLHDELLVHVPADRVAEAAATVDQALADSTRRWSGGAPVRFVTDTQIIARWSETDK